ncbi:MAG: 3-oxoacyl-ACP synthase III [Chloroflexi bacterium]|nr:3-oxoacyl-ACP synthase III [Chloroflexota bacterium]
MRYEKVCVESFGYELPDNVVTSLALEERLAPVYAKLNRSPGRLQTMTGIRERRLWDKGTQPSQGSTKAAEKAIANSGVDKKYIECLLHTSVSRDFLEPATAAIVHDSLGLPSTATIFDISNACLGFVNGMVTLANMIELGQVKAGIIVGTENPAPLINATIRELLEDKDVTRRKLNLGLASLTMGSGAASAVLTHSSISRTRHRLVGGMVRTASNHNDLCRVEGDACLSDPDSVPSMHADAHGILTNGVELICETWDALLQDLGWKHRDVDKIFGHQVSTVHNQLTFDALGLDKSKGFFTVEYLGNIGSASLPIAFALGIEKGFVKSGDKIVMMGAGSGLCSILLGLEW